MVTICILPAWIPCTQLVFAVVAIASAAAWRHRERARIAFHALLGVILVVVPSLAYSHAVVGSFDVLHNYAQRFGGTFHLGFAVFYYLKDSSKSDPIINLAKAIAASILAVSRLVTAYELYEWKSRGLHVSQSYLGAVILADVVWAVVEVYYVAKNSPSNSDEIAAICKRTQQWIEGSASQTARVLFWADAAVGFAYAFFNFAYPNEVLRAVIRREYVVDEFHALFVRDFAAHSIAPAIISLFAFQFSIQHQVSYVRQRLVTQALVCALNVYGHFVVGVYAPLHLLPFIVSFFYLALLVSIQLRVEHEARNSLVDVLDADGGISTITKKTTKTN